MFGTANPDFTHPDLADVKAINKDLKDVTGLTIV